MTYRRHYVLLDQGTQWSNKLCAIDWTLTPGSGKKPPTEAYSNELIADLPSEITRSPFLANIYGREMKGNTIHLMGDTWGAWSISKAEHDRIMRAIELTSAAAEFSRLIAYP